jgi:hypothetical protein
MAATLQGFHASFVLFAQVLVPQRVARGPGRDALPRRVGGHVRRCPQGRITEIWYNQPPSRVSALRYQRIGVARRLAAAGLTDRPLSCDLYAPQ